MKERNALSIKLATELNFREIHRAEVKEFGTGGAHIPYHKEYVGSEVIIIPIEKGVRNKRR